MRVSAVLTQNGDVWLAQCEEVERAGEGRTPDEAVASLREALKEYFEPEAVAPPRDTAASPIEIVVIGAP
jgi:predicted RNase H-like HicB family nuclease